MVMKKSRKILTITLKDWRSQLWKSLGDKKLISGGPQLIRGTSGTINSNSGSNGERIHTNKKDLINERRD